jgi:creatinine amidohydrolase
MRFEECNWMDVETYLKNDDRIMCVIGACEQHAYLSLLTDTRIPLALADAAAQETGVLVAPVINYGISPYFLSYPGTISLRTTTLLDLVEDMITSLYKHGFRKILILNGHGGNDPVKGRLNELLNKFSDLRIIWYSWWLSHSIENIAIENDIKPAHANWLEAFPFTKVTEFPDKEKNPPHYQGLLSAEDTRKVFLDGSFGGPYEVDDSIMNEIFYASYLDILNYLNFENIS